MQEGRGGTFQGIYSNPQASGIVSPRKFLYTIFRNRLPRFKELPNAQAVDTEAGEQYTRQYAFSILAYPFLSLHLR